MGKRKILIICPHPEGVAPGQRLKYEQYFEHWRRNNYEVKVSSFMTRNFWNIVYKRGFLFQKIFWTFYGYIKRIYTLFTLGKFDIVYIFLWVTPFGPPIFERLYCFFAKKVIYDIDDLVFLKNKNKVNGFITFLKGRNKPIYLMRKANHVITCTPFLDEFVRKFNNNTTDISSTINTDTYIPAPKENSKKRITLGWSGSHSTSKYLLLLTKVLKELRKKYEFKVLVIGDPTFTIEGLEIEAIPWQEKSEVADLQKIDIGLYPLPEEQWVYGKSGLKALQYMALGIPTVATAIGANFRVIEDGVSGFLVRSEAEWLERITNLIEDENLRTKIGICSRIRVEKLYSIKANQSVYLSILNSV